MLVPYFADMWAEPHYQYFPFVFIAVGWLIYQRSDHVVGPPRGWVAWGLVVLWFLLTAFSILRQDVWTGGLGFVVAAIALVASLRGEDDSSLISLTFPLLMLVKLPWGLDTRLIQSL
ncbi:MAG: exosortase, partial [Planctomycetota bacterium]